MIETNIDSAWNKDAAKRDNPQTLSPKEFIFKYFKYLPWILICLVISLVISYLKIRYAIPIYHVQSSMMIEDEGGSNGSKDARFQELFMGQGSSNNLNNESQILKSSSVIDRVVRALNFQTRYYNIGKIRGAALLYPNVPFKLNIIHLADSNTGIYLSITVIGNSGFTIDKSTTPIAFGQEFDYNGNRLSFILNKSVSIANYSSNQFVVSHMPSRAVAESIMGGLQVKVPGDLSTILTLTFDGENTTLGIDVLNTLMSVYDTLIIEDKNRISTNTLRFVDDQLKILNGQLGNMEGKTAQVMVQNNAFDITGQSKIYIDNIEEMAKKEADQKVKIAVLDLVLNYIDDPKNTGRLVPTNLGIEEPTVTQFFSEYNHLQLQREANLKTTKPDNPLIKELDGTLEKVRTGMIQALRNVKQAYLLANNSLQQQVEGNKGLLKSIPGKSMQLLNIQRQQKILEDLYSFLLMKRLETAISSASTISNSRVIEQASASSEPLSPNKKGIYTFNLLIGLIIPIGIIGLSEILKDRISSRADVEKRTVAPILGEIGHSEASQTLVVSKNSRRFVAEQFRIIRSNLKYIVGKNEKPVIMVTSSFSGEGKSFISTNIGAVMALAGKKTVIMEYDIRKPKIVAGLDLKRKMGITNYIIGKASFEDLILPVQGVENLYVIPCGPIPPNPAELLLDPKVDELMDKVRSNFDVVILDTAPVGLVSDAINLGKYADCTLFIVRQGHTFRKQIVLIESMYTEKRLPSISILLNDVKVEGGYYGGYYDGYGYHSGYGPAIDSGYFESESKTGWAKKSFMGRLIRWIRNIFSN